MLQLVAIEGSQQRQRFRMQPAERLVLHRVAAFQLADEQLTVGPNLDFSRPVRTGPAQPEEEPLSHEQTLRDGERAAVDLTRLLLNFIPRCS